MSRISNIQSALLGDNTTFGGIFSLWTETDFKVLLLNLANRPWNAPIQHTSIHVCPLNYDQFNLELQATAAYVSDKDPTQILLHTLEKKGKNCTTKQGLIKLLVKFTNHRKDKQIVSEHTLSLSAKVPFICSSSEAMANKLYEWVGRCLLRNSSHKLPPPLPSFLLFHSTGYTLRATVEQQAK